MLKKLIFLLVLSGMAAMPGLAAPVSQIEDQVAMAYVLGNEVWLADEEGNSIYNTSLTLEDRQAATLFWSPDGKNLYVATRSGLYAISAAGSAPVRLPGVFGLTLAFARHGGTLYNLDIENQQTVDENTLAYPLRETSLANMAEGRGRLLDYLGAYANGSGELSVTHAAALYARDNGLLGSGRPHLWATYGNALFYTCCFPNPGLGLINLGTGEIIPGYDPTFIPGAAALNDAASRLAGPTTDGRIRLIDLISVTAWDYVLDVPGGYDAIERMAWAIDDSAIYFVTRELPEQPLELLSGITFPGDTRSAYSTLWQLDLISGRVSLLAEFGDIFGVSSLAATHDYVFAVVVERNEALINALNRSEIPASIAPTDPMLNNYMPRRVLYRFDRQNEVLTPLTENVWGVTARPS